MQAPSTGTEPARPLPPRGPDNTRVRRSVLRLQLRRVPAIGASAQRGARRCGWVCRVRARGGQWHQTRLRGWVQSSWGAGAAACEPRRQGLSRAVGLLEEPASPPPPRTVGVLALGAGAAAGGGCRYWDVWGPWEGGDGRGGGGGVSGVGDSGDSVWDGWRRSVGGGRSVQGLQGQT